MNKKARRNILINKIGLDSNVVDQLIMFGGKHSLWIGKQLQTIKEINSKKLQELQPDFQYIIDWVRGSGMRGQQIHLNDYNLKEAMAAAKTWHKEIQLESHDNITIDDGEGEIIMRFPDGFYWLDLKKSNCQKEAMAMGHCGVATSGNTLLSLRKNKRPHITADVSPDYSYYNQMKGKQNCKPKKKYHSYILELLTQYEMTSNCCGSYDFQLIDLDHDTLKTLAVEKKFRHSIISQATNNGWAYTKIQHIIPDIVKNEYEISRITKQHGIQQANYDKDTDTYSFEVSFMPSDALYGFKPDVFTDKKITCIKVIKDIWGSNDKALYIDFDLDQCDEFIALHRDIIVSKNVKLPKRIVCRSIEFNGISKINGLKELDGDIEIVNSEKFNANNLNHIRGEVWSDLTTAKISNFDIKPHRFNQGINVTAAFRKRDLASNDIALLKKYGVVSFEESEDTDHIDITNSVLKAEHIHLTKNDTDLFVKDINGRLKYDLDISKNLRISCDFNDFAKVKHASKVYIDATPNKTYKKFNIDFTGLVADELHISTSIVDPKNTLKDAKVKRVFFNHVLVDCVPSVASRIEFTSASAKDVKGSTAKYWSFNAWRKSKLPEGMPNEIQTINISRYGWGEITKLKSLEGCPQIVKRNFICKDVDLNSLDGMPTKIGGKCDVRNALKHGHTIMDKINEVCEVKGQLLSDRSSSDVKSVDISEAQIKKFTDLGLTQYRSKRLDKNKTWRFIDDITNRFYTVNAKTGHAYWQNLYVNGEQNKYVVTDVYDLDIQIELQLDLIKKHRASKAKSKS